MKHSETFYSVFMRSISAYKLKGVYVERFRSLYKCEAESTYNTALMLIGAEGSHIYGAKLTVTTNGVTQTLQEQAGSIPAIKTRTEGDYNERNRPMSYAGYR